MMAQTETQTYGYNVRDELISGQGLTHNYDDIGNRTVAEGKTYTANNLNQYTAIDSFMPEYDADGNQTLIKTSTGVWSVTYNAENRPVRWEQGDVVVTMDFDRMGRRTFYKEMNGNTQVTFTRFIYKDYLCVRQVFSNSPYNTYKNFVWDPTETIATRPLKLQLPTMSLNLFYMHDGNKNVSDVVYRLTSNGIAAHYDYAPFGAVTRSISNAVPTADITTLNPFRFSSEYHDDTLGLVYYNYRHYNPTDGRWCGRDPLGEEDSLNLFIFLRNASVNHFDKLGLKCYIYTWKNSTVGHSSIKCGDTYISRFPEIGQKTLFVPDTTENGEMQAKGWKRTFADDMKEYKGNYTVTETDCLDESKIKEWFEKVYGDENNTYFLGTNDCTDAVTDAMQNAVKDGNGNKPTSEDCPQPSAIEKISGLEAAVEDILENQSLTLPSTVEEKVKLLNANDCKRYRCIFRCRPKFNAL